MGIAWNTNGGASSGRSRRRRTPGPTIKTKYSNLGWEHHDDAAELERERASYSTAVPILARVFQDDDGRTTHLSSDDDETTIAMLERDAPPALKLCRPQPHG